jgi:hypothetical protein
MVLILGASRNAEQTISEWGGFMMHTKQEEQKRRTVACNWGRAISEYRRFVLRSPEK